MNLVEQMNQVRAALGGAYRVSDDAVLVAAVLLTLKVELQEVQRVVQELPANG